MSAISGGDQLARHRHGGRYLPPPHAQGRQRTTTTCGRRAWPRPSGAFYAVAFAGWRQASGLADRGREHGGLAVLRLAAGRVRAGVLLAAGAAARRRSSACWPAKRPSSARSYFTDISFLWYNVIGCVVVVGTALAITYFAPAASGNASQAERQHRRRGRRDDAEWRWTLRRRRLPSLPQQSSRA